MKSYKSHTVTDRMIDQNYYNYEQYEHSWRSEAFCSLVSLRLLFVKQYLHEVVWKMNVYIIKCRLQLKIYSLSVKKNDDICEVTKYYHFFIKSLFSIFIDIFVFVSILSISKNIDTYRYLSTIFLSLPPLEDYKKLCTVCSGLRFPRPLCSSLKWTPWKCLLFQKKSCITLKFNQRRHENKMKLKPVENTYFRSADFKLKILKNYFLSLISTFWALKNWKFILPYLSEVRNYKFQITFGVQGVNAGTCSSCQNNSKKYIGKFQSIFERDGNDSAFLAS